jgi:DNA-binding CsgD family transcriptional regulator
MLELAWNKVKRSFTPEKANEVWQQFVTKAAEDSEDVDVQPYIENALLMNVFSHEPNQFICVLDIKKHSIAWFSENTTNFFGIANTDLKDKGLLFMFKYLVPEHRMLPFQGFALGVFILGNSKLKQKEELVGFQYCNVRVSNPTTGEINSYFIRQYSIKIGVEGYPMFYLSIFTNINHLVKGDTYWGRAEVGTTEKTIKHFRTGDFFATNGDLLSVREMEILQLVSKGLESEEIAQNLFLSVHTIEKHRKNMLQKMGARNSTAMVELAKMCRMIA